VERAALFICSMNILGQQPTSALGQCHGEEIAACFQSITLLIRHVFSDQLVNHFIDIFSTNTVIPVVGWVEAIAETPSSLPPHFALPILRGLSPPNPKLFN
jgi:hypothetical protein